MLEELSRGSAGVLWVAEFPTRSEMKVCDGLAQLRKSLSFGKICIDNPPPSATIPFMNHQSASKPISRRQVLKFGALAGASAAGLELWFPKTALAWDGACVADLFNFGEWLGVRNFGAGWTYGNIAWWHTLYCAGSAIEYKSGKKYNSTFYTYATTRDWPDGFYAMAAGARNDRGEGTFYANDQILLVT